MCHPDEGLQSPQPCSEWAAPHTPGNSAELGWTAQGLDFSGRVMHMLTGPPLCSGVRVLALYSLWDFVPH